MLVVAVLVDAELVAGAAEDESLAGVEDSVTVTVLEESELCSDVPSEHPVSRTVKVAAPAATTRMRSG
ncbi:hypothetical protein GCM10027055_18930 [Janibacter alkaliphilus]